MLDHFDMPYGLGLPVVVSRIFLTASSQEKHQCHIRDCSDPQDGLLIVQPGAYLRVAHPTRRLDRRRRTILKMGPGTTFGKSCDDLCPRHTAQGGSPHLTRRLAVITNPPEAQTINRSRSHNVAYFPMGRQCAPSLLRSASISA